jgi:hypothetical protein
VPGSIVPDHDERLFAVVGQAFGEPPELRGGDVTDWTPLHEANEHGLGVCAPHAVTGERCGIGGVCVRGLLHQAERLSVSPGVQGGVGRTAPPHFIGKSDHPRRVTRGQAH